MNEKSMTALICCFARCYHYKNNIFRIYSDNLAEKILSEDEYNNISLNMIKGIKYFNPSFVGNDEEALRFIVDKQLSPSVLGRSAFCESMLNQEIKLGCKQYLIFASGYDCSGYKYSENNIDVYEIDKKDMIDDKIIRIKSANINNNNITYIRTDFTDIKWINDIRIKDEKSFSSLMGISYYISKDSFSNIIKDISNIITSGSSIIFDYPTYDGDNETRKIEELAKGANEEMITKYSYKEIQQILEDNNMYIYEHLNDIEMTNEYFYDYNTLNPNKKIVAPNGVAYCYAVKKI